MRQVAIFLGYCVSFLLIGSGLTDDPSPSSEFVTDFGASEGSSTSIHIDQKFVSPSQVTTDVSRKRVTRRKASSKSMEEPARDQPKKIPSTIERDSETSIGKTTPQAASVNHDASITLKSEEKLEEDEELTEAEGIRSDEHYPDNGSNYDEYEENHFESDAEGQQKTPREPSSEEELWQEEEEGEASSQQQSGKTDDSPTNVTVVKPQKRKKKKKKNKLPDYVVGRGWVGDTTVLRKRLKACRNYQDWDSESSESDEQEEQGPTSQDDSEEGTPLNTKYRYQNDDCNNRSKSNDRERSLGGFGRNGSESATYRRGDEESQFRNDANSRSDGTYRQFGGDDNRRHDGGYRDNDRRRTGGYRGSDLRGGDNGRSGERYRDTDHRRDNDNRNGGGHRGSDLRRDDNGRSGERYRDSNHRRDNDRRNGGGYRESNFRRDDSKRSGGGYGESNFRRDDSRRRGGDYRESSFRKEDDYRRQDGGYRKTNFRNYDDRSDCGYRRSNFRRDVDRRGSLYNEKDRSRGHEDE